MRPIIRTGPGKGEQCFDPREQSDRERGDQRQHNRTSRDQEGQYIDPQEASLFLLFVSDVERNDNRARTVAGTKQGEQERKQQPQAFLPVGSLDHVEQLLANELGRVGGHHPHHGLHILDDGRRLGDQTVAEDEGAQKRDKGKEPVKCDACGDQTHIIVRRLFEAAP